MQTYLSYHDARAVLVAVKVKPHSGRRRFPGYVTVRLGCVCHGGQTATVRMDALSVRQTPLRLTH